MERRRRGKGRGGWRKVMRFGRSTPARDTLNATVGEEIKETAPKSDPTKRHLGSSDARKKTGIRGPLSLAISAPVGTVSRAIDREGGAGHFWKSEKQPVKASQPASDPAKELEQWRTSARLCWKTTLIEHPRAQTARVAAGAVVDMNVKVFHLGSGSWSVLYPAHVTVFFPPFLAGISCLWYHWACTAQ